MTVKYATDFDPITIYVNRQNILEVQLTLKMKLLDDKKQFSLSVIDCENYEIIRYEEISTLGSKFDKLAATKLSISLFGNLLKKINDESLNEDISDVLKAKVGDLKLNLYLINIFSCLIHVYITSIEETIEKFYESIQKDIVEVNNSNNSSKI